MSNGGKCIGFSDAHFGAPRNLISPGHSTSMADGWYVFLKLIMLQFYFLLVEKLVTHLAY